jgi:hypothetical protein
MLLALRQKDQMRLAQRLKGLKDQMMKDLML